MREAIVVVSNYPFYYLHLPRGMRLLSRYHSFERVSDIFHYARKKPNEQNLRLIMNLLGLSELIAFRRYDYCLML